MPVWGGVRYRDLYPGVDLEVLGEGGRWSWRLVARGIQGLALADVEAMLANVQLQVGGAEDVEVEGDTFRLGTAVGDVRLPLLATIAAGGSPLAPRGPPAPAPLGAYASNPRRTALARRGTLELTTMREDVDNRIVLPPRR